MASNTTTSSYPKKLILKISSSASSPKLPPTPAQSPLSNSLSPEFQLLYDQVFTALPQTPHLNPLIKKFTSEKMKQGVKLGCDIAFLNFVKKFQNLVDPTRFICDSEILTQEFEGFEKLGYDVTKLRERFNLLKKRAKQYKNLKEKAEKLEEVRKEKQAEIEEKKYHLMELAEKTMRVSNEVKIQESEIQGIESKKRKVEDDSTMTVYEFRILANNPW